MSSGHDQLPGLPGEPGRSPTGRDLPASAFANGYLTPPGSAEGLRPVPAGPQGIDPMALLQAFRRRWPLAIGLGLLMSGLAAAAAWFVVPPSKFTAHATLKIASSQPTIIFQTKESQADFTTYQETQVSLLRSRYILDKALGDPKVAALATVRSMEDPAEWLSKALDVVYNSRNMIVQLRLSGDNPDDLAVLLNAVVNAYMKDVVEREYEDRLQRLQYLEKLYTKYQDNLKSSRGSLRRLAEEAGGSDRETLTLRTQFAYESINNAQRLKMQVKSEILQAEADLKFYQDKADQLPPPVPIAAGPNGAAMDQAISALERNDPEIRSIQAEIDHLEDQIAHGKRIARKGGNDPFVKPLQARLANAQEALLDRREQLLAEAAARGEDPTAPASENPTLTLLAQTKERLLKLKMLDKSLDDEIEKAKTEAKVTNSNTLDLQTEQDQVALADETARKVGGEIESLKVELNAPKRVEIVDAAKAPKNKDEMKKVKAAGAIAVISFFGTVALVTFLELRARRIGSVNEVVRNLGLPLVGSLPALPNKTQRGLARRRGGAEVDRWRNRLVESIDATRTMLLHASRTESIRVVMITSALKGEGKTSLSSHLATSLARAGRKTLLIDCDLRKPALHRLFDVPPEPGMCEILRGEIEPSSAIHPTPAGDLDVITAGRCDPAALQILAQEGARHIFDGLAKDYDFLIVDTSPVLPVADALLLGQQVDAVLFSILHEVSCVPAVQQAYGRLTSLNIRVLGAVVNGAGGSNYGYDGYAVYGQTSMAGA